MLDQTLHLRCINGCSSYFRHAQLSPGSGVRTAGDLFEGHRLIFPRCARPDSSSGVSMYGRSLAGLILSSRTVERQIPHLGCSNSHEAFLGSGGLSAGTWGTGEKKVILSYPKIPSQIRRPRCISSCSSYFRRAELSTESGVCQFKDSSSLIHPISPTRHDLNPPNPGLVITPSSLLKHQAVGSGLTMSRVLGSSSWAIFGIS